jgi:hypothetical protein
MLVGLPLPGYILQPGKVLQCRSFQCLKTLHQQHTGVELTDEAFLPLFASAGYSHNWQYWHECEQDFTLQVEKREQEGRSGRDCKRGGIKKVDGERSQLCY